MTIDVIKTNDGISHGWIVDYYRGSKVCLNTYCGLAFASWMYQGTRQGRRNRRRPMAKIPELTTGVVDCMTCLVRAAKS